MARRPKSTIKVVKWTAPFKPIPGKPLPVVYHWRCRRGFKVASFQSRRHPEQTVIVHGSTKTAGGYQTSYFEDGVPTGDTQHRSCDEAVKELSPRWWKLKSAG